jgi:uncharacterized protein
VDVARLFCGIVIVAQEFTNQRRKKMALEMKSVCEKCGCALAPGDEVYICSYECTFCGNCAAAMDSICPNCGGELVRRPRREKQAGGTARA